MASDDKQTTADRARSRLFGGASAPSPTKKAATKPSARASAKKSPAKKKAAPAKRSAPAAKAAPTPEARKGGTNYLGDGMYLYKGREARKMSVYVSPELVPALKAAGASGKDPRGGDMSEIVESLIREAGYGSD